MESAASASPFERTDDPRGALSSDSDTPSGERRRVQRGALTRDRVLEAALALIEREGTSALSMRRVAAELGSAPMSLYRHVQNKEDLVDGVIGLALQDLTTKPLEGEGWSERALAWIHGLRAEIREHPAILPLLRSNHLVLPSVLAPVDLLLEELLRAGFPRPRAAKTAWEIMWFVLSFVSSERRVEREPEPISVSTWAMAKTHTDDLPHLADALPDFAALGMKDIFESGARHLVAGIRAEFDAHRQEQQARNVGA
mgnify:CR=1 FL=1